MIDHESIDKDRRLFKSLVNYLANDLPKVNQFVVTSMYQVNKSLNTFCQLANPYFVGKAKAEIGEIRQWATGSHKKMADGKWVKVDADGKPIPKSHEELKAQLTDKQMEYLEDKLDKLKFYNIKTLSEHKNTKDIIDAIKEENPDLEISEANKAQIIEKMKDKIKGMVELKDKPKDEEPKSDGPGLDVDPSKLKPVPNSSLGGSTGAKLYETPDGKKFVVKTNENNQGHILNESTANALYLEAGVPVPKTQVGQVPGSGPYVVSAISEFIDGDLLKNVSGEQFEKAKEELKKDFVVDALLANWDVIGMGMDNIMVGKNGKVYRIDNAGSMKYRAQGGKKDFEGKLPGELHSLRNKSINPSAHKIYGDMSDTDVATQIKEKSEALDKIANSMALTESEQSVMKARVQAMKDWSSSILDKKPEIDMAYAKKVADTHFPKLKNWTKENILSSQKTKDFAKFAQEYDKVDYSTMSKDQIVKHMSDTYMALMGKRSATSKSVAPDILPPAFKHVVKDVPTLGYDHSDKSHSELPKAMDAMSDYANKVKKSKGGKDFVDAVKAYTGSSSTMNSILRGLETGEYTSDLKVQKAKQAVMLDQFLHNAPKYTNTVYRGTQMSPNIQAIIDQMKGPDKKKGLTLEMTGFTSTSFTPNTTFSGSVFLAIKSKNGVVVKDYSSFPAENEVLFPTHAKFKVTKYLYNPKEEAMLGNGGGRDRAHYLELEEI